MKKVMFAMAALCTSASIVQAAGPSGEFRGQGEGRLSLSISKHNSVEMITTTGPVACGGAFSGYGRKIAPRILEARMREYGNTCVITIYFDEKFTSASTKEDNCLSFHGAACGFNGVLKRVH